jgi:hypothetical protein
MGFELGDLVYVKTGLPWRPRAGERGQLVGLDDGGATVLFAGVRTAFGAVIDLTVKYRLDELEHQPSRKLEGKKAWLG